MVRLRRGRGLAHRYVVLVVALVAGAVLASGLVGLWFSYQDNRDALAELQGEKAAGAAARIGQFVEQIERQLDSATRPVSPTLRRDEFRRLLFQLPALTELTYLDPDGREEVRVSRIAPDVVGGGADRSRDASFEAARSGRPYRGPVYFKGGTEPYMRIARREAGAQAGVVIGEVNLALITDVVSDISVGERGEAYAVDGRGVLVAHRDLTLVLGRRDLSSLSQVRAAIAGGGRRSGIIARDIDGDRVLTSYQVIRPLGWPVFVQQPLDEAFAALGEVVIRTLVLMALGLLLAAAVGTVVARRMVSPLVELQRGAARIGAGALDQRIEVDSGDELEDLAEEFNRMAARLRESYAGLEQKVEDRTAQLREVLEALEEANRHKSEFLAHMSHELRTPLNAIIGFSEVLRERMYGDINERQEEYLTDIVTSGQHLLSLINDVLDLAKVEAGRMELELGPVDFAALLEGAVGMLRERAASEGVRLDTDFEADVGIIEADERKLKQVLFNLLSNAVKFTPEGGRVRMSGAVAGDELVVSVADTGIGIAPEDRERVFEEFGQVSSVAVKGREGTGLGLPLAKRFVELHGGRLWFDSEPGVGSTFRFALPLRRPAEVPRRTADTDGDRLPDAPAVLLVEDDPKAAELLRIYLEDAGFEVVLAADGEQGLDRARRLAPEVIVLDVMLSGPGGWELLSTLKADPGLCDVPVVVVSMLDERGKGFALGAAEYLVKPVGRNELVAAIGRVASRPERVLVVDDDPMALELVRAVLTAEGIAVDVADGGERGIAAATADPPDLVILDLVMPDVDGFTVLEALRAAPATTSVPVLVLTSATLSPSDKQALTDQIAHLARKADFDRASFVELVHSCCRARTG